MTQSMVMFSMKKWMRNGIYILLVVLFAFSQIFNIFSNRGNLVKIGKRNITVRDVVDIGGRDEATFRSALQVLIYFAYIFNESDSIGLKLAEQDIQNYAKTVLNDDEALNQFQLDKTKINSNGLQNIIKAFLLQKQLFSLITFGINPSDEFIEALIKGVTSSKSGYIGEIDYNSIDQDMINKYNVSPNKDDLFKYLLSIYGRKYAQPKCYVFYLTSRDIYPSDATLAYLLDNYKYTEHDCHSGSIIVDEIGIIDIGNININSNSYRTTLRESSSGQRYIIYYNPFVPNMNNTINAWKVSRFAKMRVAQLICAEIADQINQLKTKEEKIEFITKGHNSKLQFRPIKDVSFANNFQAQRCIKCESAKEKCINCKINDCTCINCFNAANPQGISRIAAVNMLQNPDAASYTDHKSTGITVPIDHNYDETVINSAEIANIIKRNYQQDCQESIITTLSYTGIT